MPVYWMACQLETDHSTGRSTQEKFISLRKAVNEFSRQIWEVQPNLLVFWSGIGIGKIAEACEGHIDRGQDFILLRRENSPDAVSIGYSENLSMFKNFWRDMKQIG